MNDAPVSRGTVSLGTMSCGGMFTLAPSVLLSRAMDVDGDRLTVRNLRITSGSGALAANNDGTWTLSSQAGYQGPVSLSYEASDGRLATAASATVSVTAQTVLSISGPPDSPSHVYGYGITFSSYGGNQLRFDQPVSYGGLPCIMNIYVRGQYRAKITFTTPFFGRTLTFTHVDSHGVSTNFGTTFQSGAVFL